MDPITILFAIATIVGLAAPVAQEIISTVGNDKSSTLYKQAEAIAKRVNSNQSLLEQLTDAYNRRDSNLLNSLLNSSGLGARANSIRDEIKQNYTEYRVKKNEISNRIAEDNTQYNKTLNSAETAKNGTISGLSQAGSIIDENKQKESSHNTDMTIQQNVNGGLNS